MKPRFSSSVIGNAHQISPFLFLLLAFIIFLMVLYNEELSFMVVHVKPYGCNLNALNWNHNSRQNKSEKLLPFAVGKIKEGCDLFSGKWVRDELTRPLYQESDCPYIKPQVKCQANGRPDNEYIYWRWQPHGCSIPRFNATLMLETLRGKKMMFVGDSLIRGQFVSMVCLLHSTIPNNSKSMDTYGNKFKAKDYNVTIEFYWAPFLLESNSDNPAAHRISESDRMVRIGSINKHGQHWRGVDILVYNSYLWWMTGRTFKILDEMKEIVKVRTEDAYSMGMKSMLRWIETNMDPNKTRVFFTGMSPSHNKSSEWGGKPNGNCYDETQLIKNSTYWGSDTRKSIMRITDKILSESKVPITYLNITQLSSYRKDAHTSVYKKQWRKLTTEELMNPVSYADCVHWCLPGLQDTWNELLFTTLFYS